MGRILLIVFLLGCFNVAAQKTVPIKKYHKGPGPGKLRSYREKYNVMEDDRSVLHGVYEAFDWKDKPIVSGYYKQGKKDSIWSEYSFGGRFVSSQGHYSEGKKTGIWTFYEDADTMELKYDFDNGRLIYFKADASKKYSVLTGADTTQTTLDQPPIYLNGSDYINRVLVDSISYPAEARDRNIQGRVLVAFTIYADGRASAPWIKRGVHKSLDTESLRVFSMLPQNWLPGMMNGKPVTSVFVLPVIFSLE